MVKIYNQTQISVRFGDAWSPPCDWATFDLAHWPEPWPPQLSPPANAVPLTVDIGVPPDFNGNVTIIVSRTGVEVVRGDFDEDDLPQCRGTPPSAAPPSAPAASADW